MSELPPGFVLDQPTALPTGFVLDKPSMLDEAGKSVASGLGNATIQALGGAGDIRSLLSQGVDAAGSRLGVDLSGLKTVAGRAFPVLNSLPTSQDVRATVTDPIVSPDYQPETPLGSFLKKGAEFAPGMLAGGPRSIGGKIITNIIAPTVGSEIGEKLGGPLGGVAGAVVGGAGAASIAERFNQAMAARSAAKAIPSGDALVARGSGGFDQANNMGVASEPDWAVSSAAKMRNDLKGFDPEAQTAVFKAADRLENLGKPSSPAMTPAQRLQAEMNWEPIPAPRPAAPVEMSEVELIRKQLSDLKGGLDPSMRAAARKAIESLQESQVGLTPAQTVRGNAAEYTKTLTDAIGDYAAGKRSQTIQGKRNLAELNANSPVGALDSGTAAQALQRTMKQLARPMNNTNVPVARKLGFNDPEIAAINEAASGTKMQHAAEVLDRVVPAKLAAIPAMIARQIGGLTTKRQVAALDSLVRSRSPYAAQIAAQMPEVTKRLSPKAQGLLVGSVSGLLARPQ